MSEQEVGLVMKFFSKPSVAAIEVKGGGIKKGDILKFKGHTTDFTDTVASIEIDNKAVEEAPSGSMVGIKVKERVREGDKVYRVTD